MEKNAETEKNYPWAFFQHQNKWSWIIQFRADRIFLGSAWPNSAGTTLCVIHGPMFDGVHQRDWPRDLSAMQISDSTFLGHFYWNYPCSSCDRPALFDTKLFRYILECSTPDCIAWHHWQDLFLRGNGSQHLFLYPIFKSADNRCSSLLLSGAKREMNSTVVCPVTDWFYLC